MYCILYECMVILYSVTIYPLSTNPVEEVHVNTAEDWLANPPRYSTVTLVLVLIVGGVGVCDSGCTLSIGAGPDGVVHLTRTLAVRSGT